MTTNAFHTRCISDARPDTLLLAVHFVQGGTQIDEATVSLDDYLTAVANFGSIGGWGGGTVSPARSKINLRGCTTDDYQSQWHFDHVNVDPALMGVVENIVARVSLRIAPVDELTVRSSMCRSPDQLPRPLLPHFRPLPFRLENVSEDSRVVISVEFREPQQDDCRAPFLNAWETWVKLTESGAFSDDDHSVASTGLIVPELPQSLPTGLMFRHERVRLPDFAFDCLINAFSCLHERVAHLEEVVIS